MSPKRCSSDVVSCGMRVEVSAIGVSSTDSTVQPAQVLMIACHRVGLGDRDARRCESVKMTTPALPSESAMA